MTSIEERLQRLEDVMAIQQLFVDYGRHLDAGNWEAYAALFAEDGEILLGPVRARGRDQIRQAMNDSLGEQVGTTFHLISSPEVTLDGDRATTEVMWTVLQKQPSGAPEVTMCGKHRDEVRRIGGTWLFQRRKGFVDLLAAPPLVG